MSWQELSEHRRTQLLLAGATILALLPFLNRAFDIDEPLFLWMAQQIARAPFDPYGFEANWAGFAQPMWQPMQNPPLCSYYIAGVATVIGWSEPALHAAFLLPAIAAVLGTFALARRLCERPATAALLTLLTPVFLVSSASVMCDVMLLAFWVWSIELWLAGLERGQHWLFASSAFLTAAAILTKYFGVALVPLLLVYTLVQTRRCRATLAYLCIPLLALVSYELITYARYGMPLFTGAMLYLHQVAEAGKAPLTINSLTGCSFLGGSILTVLFVTPWKRRWALGAVALWLTMTVLFAVFVVGLGAFGNNTAAMQAQGGLFAAAGLATLALAFYHFGQRNDAPSLILLLWIAGTFLFSAFLNWSITARTILPLVPAVSILFMRHFQASSKRSSGRFNSWGLVCAAALSLAVAWADYRLAGASREAARHFRTTFADGPARVWFQSHWGFQWYMQKWKAKPVTRTAHFRPGDIMIIPSNNADPVPVPSDSVIPFEQLERELPYITTFAPGTGAGFYSNARGPVPWLIGKVSPLRWEAVVVK